MTGNKQITIGISISETNKEELGRMGFGLVHVQDAMVETARYLLNKGYNLAYGGDLNHDHNGKFNFTELLFQLGMTYGGIKNRITNYSAFPLYTRISKKREAELVNVANIIRVNPSREFDKWLKVRYDETFGDDRQYLDWLFECKDDEAKKVWSESLTAMRKQMTLEIQGRIVMGGKTKDYRGTYPGIWEETLLSAEAGIPIWVDARFGGAALEVLKICWNEAPEGTYGLDKRVKKLAEAVPEEIADDIICIKGKNTFPDISNLLKTI